VIRTLLASPWLPLLYWAGAVIALICWAHHKTLRRSLGRYEAEVVAIGTLPTTTPGHGDSTAPEPRRASQVVSIDSHTSPSWLPLVFVLQRQNSSVLRNTTEFTRSQTSVSMQAQTPVNTSITMLSIRVEPPSQAKTLTIQCRTSMAVSNAQGRTVTIHGVVTQEVVSSAGKILIMAGSRVIGSALLDPENGRFKSVGLWSVFFDDTELKVQAVLLDRPSGLPGILGRKMSNEDLALPREAVTGDRRSIVVPRNAPFVLELHGEFLLRDTRGNEASN
jgi:hypothetical protein